MRARCFLVVATLVCACPGRTAFAQEPAPSTPPGTSTPPSESTPPPSTGVPPVPTGTPAAALALLGPEYRFKTALYADELRGSEVVGNLYVRGFGDPSFVTED